ncbi:MAG: IclR family transcriptional regulator [Deltaproteobacteria bacterium]|jgi:DNA-binding IclR family transcriptional regulator|nr:IclR family transcriptional regulator [Deltaproteobacteria bacterium]
MQDKQFVKSLFKALSIVELLDERGEMGVTEIGRALGLDKSTVFRLLSSLKERGYAAINPHTQKYSNSGKFFILAQGVLRRCKINPLLSPLLQKLAEETGETVNLAAADGDAVLYLASHETDDIVKLASSIGKRRPLHCTAAGKAILAFHQENYVRSLYAHLPLTPFTPFTLVAMDALLEDLAASRKRGYALDNQEHNLNIRCAAIPLLSPRGEPVAAVSISMPQFRHEAAPERYERCIAALLRSSSSLTVALLA